MPVPPSTPPSRRYGSSNYGSSYSSFSPSSSSYVRSLSTSSTRPLSLDRYSSVSSTYSKYSSGSLERPPLRSSLSHSTSSTSTSNVPRYSSYRAASPPRLSSRRTEDYSSSLNSLTNRYKRYDLENSSSTNSYTRFSDRETVSNGGIRSRDSSEAREILKRSRDTTPTKDYSSSYSTTSKYSSLSRLRNDDTPSTPRVSERIWSFERPSDNSTSTSTTVTVPFKSRFLKPRNTSPDSRKDSLTIVSQNESDVDNENKRPSIAELRRKYDANANALHNDLKHAEEFNGSSEQLNGRDVNVSFSACLPPTAARKKTAEEGEPEVSRLVKSACEDEAEDECGESCSTSAPEEQQQHQQPPKKEIVIADRCPALSEVSVRKKTHLLRPRSPSPSNSSIGSTSSSDHESPRNARRLVNQDAAFSSNNNSPTVTRNSVLDRSRPSALSRSSVEPSPSSSPRPSTRIELNNERVGLVGLRNIGNTCFMNSVLQCLSNSRPLLEYIVSEEYLSNINTTTSSMKGVLIKAFASVLGELWPSENPDMAVNPTVLKSQVQKFAPRFMGYSQQDAQEFLRFFLEGLHEDVNRVQVKPKPIDSDIPDHFSDNQKAIEAWKRYLRRDDSKIVDLFVGQLKSTLQCTVCGHCSVTFDPFWDLSLPIPAKSGPIKLQHCLDLFAKEEVLDGDEKPTCSKCATRRKCTKSLSIHKFPLILVLHLKRFSQTERFKKLDATVDFPLTDLDLGAYASLKGFPYSYQLYGVANHSGSVYSGHYTAYCRHPYSSNWHEYNDSRVSQVSTSRIVSSEAYLLFYELEPQEARL